MTESSEKRRIELTKQRASYYVKAYEQAKTELEKWPLAENFTTFQWLLFFNTRFAEIVGCTRGVAIYAADRALRMHNVWSMTPAQSSVYVTLLGALHGNMHCAACRESEASMLALQQPEIVMEQCGSVGWFKYHIVGALLQVGSWSYNNLNNLGQEDWSNLDHRFPTYGIHGEWEKPFEFSQNQYLRDCLSKVAQFHQIHSQEMPEFLISVSELLLGCCRLGHSKNEPCVIHDDIIYGPREVVSKFEQIRVVEKLGEELWAAGFREKMPDRDEVPASVEKLAKQLKTIVTKKDSDLG